MSRYSQTTRSAPSSRRTLNTWLLIISAVVLFVVAPCAYFWYHYQTRHLADTFLTRADQLLAEDKPREAAEYMQRYLQIRPQDSIVRARLAETYDRSATTREGKTRAIELYYQALGFGANEGNAELRESIQKKEPSLHQRLGELLSETGQFGAAEDEAGKTLELAKARLKTDPHDNQAGELRSQAKRLLAQAIYEQCKLGSGKGATPRSGASRKSSRKPWNAIAVIRN